ncbi:MAG: segregation/condensation protein A [Chthonomonas sp.]|nr:segregation/condensation protein A [Chthonomonas sp.]
MSSESTHIQKLTRLGFASEPPITVECEAFSGSLGMLLNSVRNQRVDLLGVPLLPICEAYFSYLLGRADHDQDLEEAGSALVALSFLVERKAWRLIPVPTLATEDLEEGSDFEYEASVHEYADAVECLSLWYQDREQRFFRTGGDETLYEVPYEMGAVTAGDLSRALERLLKRAVPERPEILNKPRRSLAQQMVEVAKVLPKEFRPLDEIVVGEFTRTEAVWWFLALLELIRLGQARVQLLGEDVLFAAGELPS